MAATAHPPAEFPVQTYTGRIADRLAAGKALRAVCTRRAAGDWQPAGNRADPVTLLKANSAGRQKDLIPLRYGRMLESPFAFYRGAAAIMAHDLSAGPHTAMPLLICGDAHLMNFGGFATPERRLIFDINDFDEVSIAPWEWDVKRLAASFHIAAAARGFDAADRDSAAREAARAYRLNLTRHADMPVLDAYYESIDLKDLLDAGGDDEMKTFHHKRLAKIAERNAHNHEFAKLACSAGEIPRIRDEPPLIFHVDDIHRSRAYRRAAETMLANYRANLPPERRLLIDRYAIADVAMKVVGVGSVGTRCGIALLMSGNGDPLFLQFKEARPSVLEAYAGAAPFAHAGERVVFGQRLMQAASDIFLAPTTGASGRHYYIRQLRDAKISTVIEVMKPDNLRQYANACGRALARAHKRSGDAVVLSGYLGSSDAFEDAMMAFARSYAAQNERDHDALRRAVRSGRIEARSDGS